MRIAFKFPSRSRPEKFKKAVSNIIALANRDYTIYATLDNDDPTVDEELLKWCRENNVRVISGHSKSKIDAVNRGMDKLEYYGILVVMSDDMEFLVKGFDDMIRIDMVNNFPDLDGVLHYNDGFQKSNVMTMSIMGRKYYERTKYIYNPDYRSVWCDVEATEVAYMLDKYKYLGNDKMIFRHNHPVWKLAEWDEQYRQSESPENYEHDKRVLLAQRANKYGLRKEEIVNDFKYANL